MRRIFTIFCLLLLAGAIWGAVYVRKHGFSHGWRQRIEAEVAKQGYFVDIGKLTLGPLRGLVAEDVRFFQTKNRDEVIAVVDDVFLDLDLTKIFDGKQLTIKTLDIQEAKLSLPLEPGNPDKEKVKLNIEKVSGRIVVTDNQIEIVRVNAEVEGIAMSIKGTLFRPEEMEEIFAGKGGASSDVKSRRDALAEMSVRRRQVREFLRELRRIEYLEEGATPSVNVEFRSDLGDLSGQLRASARLDLPKFRMGSYDVESLSVWGEYDGQERKATLNELKLRDQKGELRLDGEWQEEANEASFSLNSSADVTALATTIMKNRRNVVGEVVFFSPPKIEVEGKLRLNELRELGDADAPEFWVPAEVIGKFRCDRFVATGGEIFDGLEFDFSASGDRVFVRDARLDHKTGQVKANALFDAAAGDEAFRFQSEIKMDPRAFLPFFGNEETRDFLESWDFGAESTVYLAAVGQGPTLDSKTWKTGGIVDLRNFKLKGEPFSELEAEYELDGYIHIYRAVRLVKNGAINADEVIYDAHSKIWKMPRELANLELFDDAEVFVSEKPEESEEK